MKRRAAGVLIVMGICAGCSQWGQSSATQAVSANSPIVRVQNLLNEMNSNNPSIRRDAARQLGNLREDQPAVRQALAEGLRDESREVRQASAEALRKMGSLSATACLRDAGKKGQAEARDAYEELVRDLKKRARLGDADAKAQLDQLGERQFQV